MLTFAIILLAVWVILGLKSKKFYGMVKFLALHSKYIGTPLFHLIVIGERSLFVRIIALLTTGFIFGAISFIVLILLAPILLSFVSK